jgi:hypothetical protein
VIIKSRSEYLKKKNDMAMNQAKERQEINNIVENELKKSTSASLIKSKKAKSRHD